MEDPNLGVVEVLNGVAIDDLDVPAFNTVLDAADDLAEKNGAASTICPLLFLMSSTYTVFITSEPR